ncbi:MAG: FHA domain-containing protein [Lentisphaerae bacterium]|nr:FHA domain-containing protein [Lentisphaerota bacterium]
MILTLLKPGQSTPVTENLPDGNYIVGRSSLSRIVLAYADVSERHALISVRDGKATVEDLKSANGTYVNGVQIDRRTALSDDSIVQIGGTVLRMTDSQPQRDAVPERKEAVSAPVERTPASVATASPQPSAVPHAKVDPQATLRRKIREQIQDELIVRMDLKRLTASGVDREGLERQAHEKISEIVAEVIRSGKLPRSIDPERIKKEVFDEALRLGPLEDLLDDPSVSEIMVNGPHQVYVERGGRLQLTDLQFADDASVSAIIERIVAPLGRRIDESQPYVDARLKDGSRVNAIIPPLSLSGPSITIRKFSKKTLTVEDFIRFGTWNANAAAFMEVCVKLRKNIIVAGGTGSGKTTLLNLLSSFIPETERIVTVEDAAELKLVQPHVVRLEARPANVEGKGAVTIRDLVKNCLRMRPDRIIVGECRSGEALDMLQAMNTGHDGSLTTVHANSPRDVVSRLETMVLMSGMELPSRAIREQIASAVDIIIHESRLADGSRKVTAITEVTGMEGQNIVMQDIFAFRQSGVDENGRIVGEFRPTGAMPTFFDTLKSRGMNLDPGIFQP